MNAIDLAPVGLFAILAISSIVQRRMMTAAQPARLKLAEKGEKLLARTDVPNRMRREVEGMLDSAFPCNCLLMFLIIPIVPAIVIGWLIYRLNKPVTAEACNQDVSGRYLEIRALHRKIEMANHPVLTPIIEFMVAFSLILVLPFLLLARRSADLAFDRDSATLSLEMQRQASRWMPHFSWQRKLA